MVNDVSILIPCYNADRWINRCIESAIAQTPKEIIIIDDGSTDNSWEIIKSFGLRSYTRERSGATATRNQLIELASSNWIQFLDADDELMPGKIEIQIQEAGNADVIFSDPIVEIWQEENLLRKEIAKTDEDLLKALIRFDLIAPTSAYLFKKDLFDDRQVRWPDAPVYQDAWLLTAAAKVNATFKKVESPDAIYRLGWSKGQISASTPRAEKHRSRQYLLDCLKEFLGDRYPNEFAIAQLRLEAEMSGRAFRLS